MSAAPFWAEVVAAVLLVAGGLFSLLASIGLVRLKDFFDRMHPPALSYTFSAWCVTFASIIYFSALDGRPVLHVWLIIVLLSITVPITTILLSRATLFRRRRAGDQSMPPAQGERRKKNRAPDAP